MHFLIVKLRPVPLIKKHVSLTQLSYYYIIHYYDITFMLPVPLDSTIESVIAVGGVSLWMSSVCWDTQ